MDFLGIAALSSNRRLPPPCSVARGNDGARWAVGGAAPARRAALASQRDNAVYDWLKLIPKPLPASRVNSLSAQQGHQLNGGALHVGGRFIVIDGLRGIAALMVVVFHLSDVAGLQSAPLLGVVMSQGGFGVEVFFVLSGFVIAYSVRNVDHTFQFFTRFVLRRWIRLDPPLWTVIAAELCLLYLGSILVPTHEVVMPATSDVLANLVYVQWITGSVHVLPIFWTLCYEIQFYLTLAGSLVLARIALRRFAWLDRRRLLMGVGAVTFVLSVAVDAGLLAQPMEGLFVDRWYQFCLGIATVAVLLRQMKLSYLMFAWLVIAVLLLAGAATEYTIDSAIVCIATSALIACSACSKTLTKFAATAPIQFLGRISYSLYLIHLVIGWRFVSVATRIWPTTIGRTTLFICGVLLSVFSAYLLYLIVERPALRFASRLSRARSTAKRGSGLVPEVA